MSRFFKPATGNSVVGDIIVNLVDDFQNAITESDIQIGDVIRGYDITEFFDDLQELFLQLQKQTNVFKDFSFLPGSTHFIPSEDESNALRYNLVKRSYLPTDNPSNHHGGRKDSRWQLIDIVEDKEAPKYKVLVLRKQYINTIKLVSWSKNYRDSNLGAINTEKIMDTYKYLFRRAGLIDMRYIQRDEDIVKEVSNKVWYGVPLLYELKTNAIQLVRENTLETLLLELINKNTN